MGEEEKKVEAEKTDEGKKEEAPAEKEAKKGDEKKDAGGEGDGGEKKSEDGGGDGEEKKDTPPPPPPPPEEIIMRVYMHCEGCSRKVQRSLKGFEGVEDVKTDCRTHKVVVKGKVAAADPMKVVQRVEKKAGRKVELLTPIPPKPEKKEEKEEEKPKPEEKKVEPQVIAVVLKVHMHCEACSIEIRKRILKMKGVHSVDPELKASQVTVKGVFDPPKLVEYVYKRTGKHAVVVKVDPEEKPAEKPKDQGEQDTGKDEKKADGGGDEKKEGSEGGEGKKKEGEEKEAKDGNAGGGDGGEKEGKDAVSEESLMVATGKKVELKKNEFYYYYPRYNEGYVHLPPPQIFSDENPNACILM